METLRKLLLPGMAVLLIATGSQLAAAERPTDDTIRFWIKDALSEDPYLDASCVEVQVNDGLVTLSGTVRSIAAQKYADIETKKIAGVLGVVNQVSVVPVHRWDADIVRDVRHRIIDSAAIEAQDIKVICQDGTVELAGVVRSWSEREEAGLLASEVLGVKRVQNYLTVEWEAERPDAAIKKDAVAALHRDAYLVDMPISVSVKDGVITLSGTIGSVYQKTLAYDDIRWIENVKEVKNNLKVEWWENKGTRTDTLFPTDAELGNAVSMELFSDSRLTPMNLEVTVQHGHATLRGTVANNYQKQIASADARDVVGVTWVTNHLTPRTDRRDDVRIRDDILSNFATDEALWNQPIAVTVKNAVVTLSGQVERGYDKPHAKMLASRVRGVTEIVDNITVNWAQERDDAAVFKRIVDRLKSDWLLGPNHQQFKVQVQDGVATLTGTVNNWGQRSEIEDVVLRTHGVRAVDNRLHVKGYAYPLEDWRDANSRHAMYPHEIDPYGL